MTSPGFARAPWRYDLWQAYVAMQHESPSANAWRKGWRFSIPARLSFQTGEIQGFRRESASTAPTDAPRFILETNVPGLLGPGGPVPLHVTETIARESRLGNAAPQDFLDIFQNRLLRLWLDDASAMCAELGPAKRDGDLLSAVCALSLAGEPSASGETKAPEDSVFQNPYIWGDGPPTAAGLERLLEDGFPLRARVCCLVGSWREFDAGCRTRLGEGDRRTLGGNAVLGGQAFDVSSGLRISLSFDEKATAEAFLPSSPKSRHPELRRLIRAYIGDAFQVTLELTVAGHPISTLRLKEP